MGRYDEAKDHGERAYELLRMTAAHREVGQIQRHLGKALLRLGEIQEGRRFLDDSVGTFHRIADEEEMIKSINAVMLACVITSRWDEAIQHLEYGLEISRRAGRIREVASLSGNLGTVYRMADHWQRAEECLSESLKIYERLGDELGVCHGLISLGRLLIIRRRWDEATRLLERAQSLSQEYDYTLELAQTHSSLGQLNYERSKYEMALDHYRVALDIGRRIAPEGDIITHVQRHLGEVYLALKRPEEARQAVREALTVSKKLDNTFEEALAYRVLGMVCQDHGEIDEAYRHLALSVEELTRIGEQYKRAKSLLLYGRLVLNHFSGKRDYGHSRLEEARRLFHKLECEYYEAIVLIEMVRWKLRDVSVLDRARELLQADQELEGGSSYKERVECFERDLIKETLTLCKWNTAKAAMVLKLSQRAVQKKIAKYGLKPRRTNGRLETNDNSLT